MKRSLAWMGVLAALTCLAACEDKSEQGHANRFGDAQGIDSLADDGVGVRLRRLKDLAADGHLGDADRLMRELEHSRSSFPPGRQAEIDRAEALVTGLR